MSPKNNFVSLLCASAVFFSVETSAAISEKSKPKKIEAAKELQQLVAVPTTKCCWCHYQYVTQDSVKIYSDRASCDVRGLGMYATCRGVDVEGSSCSFISIAHNGGRSQCKIRSLVIREGSAIKTIAPPDWTSSACPQHAYEKNPDASLLVDAGAESDADPSPRAAGGGGNASLPVLETDSSGN